MSRQRPSPIAFLVLGLIGIHGCPEPSTGPKAEKKPAREIVVGVVGSLTGPQAAFGTSAKNGIDLAIDEVNEAGGIDGRKVRAIHLDDQGRAEDARVAAQRLVTRDHVHLLLGSVASAPSLAMAAVAERARVPMITPSSTLPAVTEVGEYVFRVCYLDSFQGEVMARFAAEALHLEKLAILRSVDSEYSVGLADVFKKEIEARGGQVVADESYVATDPDLARVVESFSKSGAQAVYMPSYYADVRELLPKLREAGLKLRFLGADGWDSDELLRDAGAAIEGAHFTSHFHSDDPRPEVETFVRAFHERFNETPDSIAALAYDAAKVALSNLVLYKGEVDPVSSRASIAATPSHVGVTGRIEFDALGNARKPAVVLEVESGKRKYVQTLEPEDGPHPN